MYVNDFCTELTTNIFGQKVLLLVNYDIDAVCTAKILQNMLGYDSMLYSLVVIQGVQDMITTFEDHSDDVKIVMLINCGGTLDIIETLQPREDITIYIIDSHRPTDVCNIYNNQQIKIVTPPEDEEAIPDFDDIFNDESDVSDEGSNEEDNDDGDVEGESQVTKRRKLNEEAILKRRERRLWEEKRNRLMFDYTQFTYFGRASAIVMYEFAWRLSKDNIDTLWWAIVGVTAQLVLGQVQPQRYQRELESLQLHIGRLCPSIIDNDDTISHHSASTIHHGYVGPVLKITSEKDLNLALYRHWTVEASLRYSMYTAVRLKLWTIRGEKRLQQLMAEMGLPLFQSRQLFNAMDLNLRREFHSMMEKIARTHELDNLIFSSFTLYNGFRSRYQATDYVYSMLALLNTGAREKLYVDCFADAANCLSRSKRHILDEGIDIAKKMLTVIFRQVQSSLDLKQVISAGPFLYLVIQEGTIDSKYYSEPSCLIMLAHLALRAYVAVSRRKAAGLPLIASAPIYKADGECLVTGVPPVSEAIPRNFFGKAFEQAAEKTGSKIEMDYFDTSVIKMKTEDRPKFFDALTALLS